MKLGDRRVGIERGQHCHAAESVRITGDCGGEFVNHDANHLDREGAILDGKPKACGSVSVNANPGCAATVRSC